MDFDKEKGEEASFLSLLTSLIDGDFALTCRHSINFCAFILHHMKKEDQAEYIRFLCFICNKEIHETEFEDTIDLISWIDERALEFKLLSENAKPINDEA